MRNSLFSLQFGVALVLAALAISQAGCAARTRISSHAVVPPPPSLPPSGTGFQPVFPSAATTGVLTASEVEDPEGPGGGIKVHGHWTIEVREPDGTLASHREFENSLVASGSQILVNPLFGSNVVGLWRVQLANLNGPETCSILGCVIVESASTAIPGPSTFKTLTVQVAPPSGNTPGFMVLAGNFTAPLTGSISSVRTFAVLCPATVLPGNCTDANVPQINFTVSTFTAIPVNAGQIVQFTVQVKFQ